MPPSSNSAILSRCFLYYGTDEPGSRAAARKCIAALGQSAQKVDLTPSQLVRDLTLLVDEARSASLFDDARYIKVDGVGEDCFAAVAALLDAEATINPVFLIAGALKKESRLVRLLSGSPVASVIASYVPSAATLARWVIDQAAIRSLRIADDVATHLVDLAGGDRALLERELDKLSSFADAAPDTPKILDHAMVDAIGADQDSADLDAIVDAVMAGDGRTLQNLLSRSIEGLPDAVPLLRSLLRRVALVAGVRAEVERGSQPRAAAERVARSAFWRDRDALVRDVGRWPPHRLATMLHRLSASERSLKSGKGTGEMGLRRLLYELASDARR